MEKIVRSRNESLNQELVEAATQQAPSKEMQYLRKQNFEQASVIAALREQMAAKDSSWEEEKMRILKDLKSERLIRKDAQKGLKGQDEQNPDLQVQFLQTPSNQLKDSHQHNTELAAENAALKQQMAAKESCWNLEKNKIRMAKRAIKIQAQNDLQNKEKEKQKVTELAAENAALREQTAGWELQKNTILNALRSERTIRKEAQRQLKEQDKQNPDLQVQLLQTPSNQLKDSQQVTDLAAENAALREQMAGWELEKNKILNALRSERTIRKEAQRHLKEQDEQNPDLQVQLLQTTSNQLKDSHQHITKLAAEIAALKQQMAAKESCWKLEKNKILIQVQNDLQTKEQEKQEVTDSLNQSLLEKQNDIVMVKQTTSNQLKDSHQHNTELAAEIAALKQQMAAKESCWELEKNKILMAQRAIKIQAQNDLQNKEKEKQKVIDSLNQSLLEKQNEILMVKQTPSNQLKDSQQHITELAAENAALKQQMAAKESRWEQEKNSSAQSLIQAQMNLQTKEQEKQEVIDSLSQSLLEKQNEILMVKQTPSNQLKDSHQHNTELAAENAALRDQMAAKESRWELEKNKILIQVQNDLQTKEQEKQEVTDSLSQSLLEKQNEIVMVKQTTSNQLKDSQQHNTELAAENAALKQQMAAKESRWEQEKNSSAQSLIQAQMNLQTKEQEKQEVIDSLSQSLLEKQNEIVMVKQTTSNQLKDSQQHNTELTAENAALRDQMAAKESRWELEKNKILIQVQNDLQTKEQEKQEVTDSLSQSLLEKQNEILMVNQCWTEKCEKACNAWKEENREIRETCERELQSALDQKNLMVKSLQDESDRKVSQVVLEKDDLITGLTTAKMALEVLTLKKETQLIQSEVRLKEKEMQLLQSEAEWSTKLAPLEYQIRLKTDTTTDLQAQLLCLQELHQKLDLGALKMTAEEMNAKKKELKKLIVEKEKEEKRQKKEREEREKREKKELKSVKKEKEALEKKEKDLKREKKERKEKEVASFLSTFFPHPPSDHPAPTPPTPTPPTPYNPYTHTPYTTYTYTL